MTPDAENATQAPEKTTINLREAMPQAYAFIEACRAAFGKESVNQMIKLGMEGAETFHAIENGIEVGTQFSEAKRFVTADQMVLNSKQDTEPPHPRKK
jgi:hypothetical protein